MATTLSAGDIAIVGVRSSGDRGSNDDAFAFVVLRDIDAGTQIKFTDNEWVRGAFNTGEGEYTYTASGVVAAGTVVTVAVDGSVPGNISLPAALGDQIIAFQGTQAGPTPIAAFQSAGTFAASGAGSGASSEVPTGLSVGGTAVGVSALSGFDDVTNWAYVGPLSGSKADLLKAIDTASNWANAVGYSGVTFPNAFAVGAPAAPAEIDLRGNGVGIVSGDASPSYADDTAFGAAAVSGGTVTHTFTIANQGGTPLDLSSIVVTGANASDFRVTQPSVSSVAANGSATFQVTFDPSAAGRRSATVTIPNSDTDEGSYAFAITGNGVADGDGTALSAGDVAIVGYNAGTTFGFAFALLAPVAAGTVVKFTDAGWTGSGLYSQEGALVWVAPADMPFGTVVTYDNASPDPSFQPTSDSYFTGAFAPGSIGDQIYAYTGSAAAPTFLGGVHYGVSTFDTAFPSSAQLTASVLPPGLADGVNILSFGNDASTYTSGVYAGSTSGDRTALLAKITNAANWQGSGTAQTLPSGTFGSGSTAPDIDVQYRGNGAPVAFGDTTPTQADGTQFEAVALSAGSQTHVFTIRNLGDQPLDLGTPTISGTDAAFGFVLGARTIGASQSTTLAVTFDPTVAGANTATLTILSNDPDEAAYSFAVRGLGRDAAQALSAGDVAFAGYDTTDKSFTFVALRDLAAGTAIKFTDGGWTGSGFRAAEGAVEWVAPTAIAAGAVVGYDGLLPNGGPDWSAADTSYFGAPFNFDALGDQIIAYQGDAAEGAAGIRNIAALQYAAATFDGAFADTNASSRLPAGLADGVTTIAFAKGGGGAYTAATYTGATDFGFDAQGLALNDAARWTGTDGNIALPSGPIGVPPVPTLTNFGDTVGYTENGAPVLLDGGQDGTATAAGVAVAQATVTIDAPAAGDILSATVSGNVSALYANGVLTLSGSDTVATYQSILRSATFSNTGEDPTVGGSKPLRRISYVLTNANAVASAPVVATVSVTAADDAPVLTTSGGSTAAQEQVATIVDADLILTDPDSGTLTGATVSITGNFQSPEDRLTFLPRAGISGVYDAATGTLGLTGSASLEAYRDALRSVTYTNASDAPNTADRTIAFSVTDGITSNGPGSTTKIVTVSAVNDPPIAIDDTFTMAEDSGATLLDLLANDSSAPDMGETLTVTAVTQPTSGGTVTLVDGLVGFTPNADFNGVTSFGYSISDGNGGTARAIASVSVTSVNDAPVNTLPATLALGNSGGALRGLSIADVDAADAPLTVELGVRRGSLNVASPLDGATIVGNGSASVTLTGTLAQIDATLSNRNGVSYHGVPGSSDTLTVTTRDGGNTGAGGPLTDTDSVAITLAGLPPQPEPPTGPTSPPGSQSGGRAISLITTTDHGAAEAVADEALRNLPGGIDPAVVEQGVAAFLADLPSGAAVNVSTFTPTPGATDIRITGPTDGTRTIFIVDASGVPAGTPVTLDDVGFVALAGPASLVGGAGSQMVHGDASAQSMMLGADDDTLHGGGGDDRVGSHGGNDALYGDAGNDTVSGGIGADFLSGGSDQDLVYGNQDSDLIYGNQDRDTLYGGQGADTIYGGQGDDRVLGNLGADELFGNRGSDIVYGNLGNDLVYGNQGDDMLYGGQGDDVLYGGQGDDQLFGGLGSDTLSGGLGADRYVLAADPGGYDLILGFSQVEGDRLELGGQAFVLGSAVDGDALLTLSGGGKLELSGIRADRIDSRYLVA